MEVAGKCTTTTMVILYKVEYIKERYDFNLEKYVVKLV